MKKVTKKILSKVINDLPDGKYDVSEILKMVEKKQEKSTDYYGYLPTVHKLYVGEKSISLKLTTDQVKAVLECLTKYLDSGNENILSMTIFTAEGRNNMVSFVAQKMKD